jgi:hypothetical protein
MVKVTILAETRHPAKADKLQVQARKAISPTQSKLPPASVPPKDPMVWM